MKMKRMLLLVAGLLVLLSVACRQGAPVIDPADREKAFGTISGTVRGPDGSSSIEGRAVEVVNLDTSERQQATTTDVGEFTLKVKPGKYRVRVALAEGESIVKGPGVMNVNRQDGDARADFVLGPARLLRPRAFAPTNDPSLGPPIG
jgi:hypothetical protein